LRPNTEGTAEITFHVRDLDSAPANITVEVAPDKEDELVKSIAVADPEDSVYTMQGTLVRLGRGGERGGGLVPLVDDIAPYAC
jgi:hypothetical protein